MRLTNVLLLAGTEEIMNLSLRDADPTARYICVGMEGLDADELIPKYYAKGAVSGKKFHEIGVKPRELVMKVTLNPRFILNESYSDLRNEVYKAVSANRSGQVEVQFLAAGTAISKLVGFITRVETDHFSKEPQVQITVKCDDGMFRGISPVIFGPADLPSSNPFTFVDTESTAPHGFLFQVKFTANVASFHMRSVDDDWVFTITPSGGFLVDDDLILSSEIGNTQCILIRASVGYFLMDKVLPGSVWPIIFPGINEFEIDEIASIDWVLLGWFTAYWGV